MLVRLLIRDHSQGKTSGVREQCESSNTDALLALGADPVLTHRNYIARLVESLFERHRRSLCARGGIVFDPRLPPGDHSGQSLLAQVQSELGL